MIVSGEFSEAELHEAWEIIYDEYIAALKDKDQVHMHKLHKQINCLEYDITLINLCIKRLSLQHSPEVLAALKKVMPMPGRFDPEQAEQYKKDLSLAMTLSKNLLLEMKDKKSELESIKPKGLNEKMDRGSFDALIIKLSKHMQYRVNKKETTVSEFIQIVVDMRDMNEAMALEALKLKQRK